MLNESQLGESIYMLYNMELNNYLATKGIRKLNYAINRLAIPRKYEEPKYIKNSLEIHFAIYLTMIGGLGGIVLGFLNSCSQFKSKGPIVAIQSLFGDGIKFLLILAIAGLILGLFIDFIICLSENSKDKKIYNDKLNEYNNAVLYDDVRVNIERRKRDVLIEQRRILQQRLQTSLSKTKQFYDIAGIDPNYRYLIPIGYMNEFISLGIATKLTGADGLYYLIRQELRWDKMQASLEEISAKLDEIIDNQRAMYSELVSMNNKCERIIQTTIQAANSINQKLDRIDTNTSITAYNSERILQEQEFQNRFLIFQSMNR